MNVLHIRQQLGEVISAAKSKTLQHIGITFIAQVGARVFSAFSLMIVLRSLTTEEFGGFTFFQAMLTVASGLLLQGVNWAMIREMAAHEPRRLTGISRSWLAITLVISGVAASGVAAFLSFAHHFLGSASVVGDQVFLASFGIISTALLSFLLAYFQGKQEFWYSAMISLGQSGAIMVAYLVLYSTNLLSFQLALVCMTVIPLMPILLVILSPTSREFRQFHMRDLDFTILQRAGWYITYSSFLVLASQLDVIMMAQYVSLSDLGVYGVASKVFSMLLLGLNAIHTVLLPRLSAHPNPLWLRGFLIRSLTFSIPSAIIVATAVLLFSREIIWVFSGNEYAEASIPLQILGVTAALSLVFSPSVNVLFALQKVRHIAWSGLLLVVIDLVGHLVITRRFGAVGAAVTTMIAYTALNGLLFLLAVIITRGEENSLRFAK